MSSCWTTNEAEGYTLHQFLIAVITTLSWTQLPTHLTFFNCQSKKKYQIPIRIIVLHLHPKNSNDLISMSTQLKPWGYLNMYLNIWQDDSVWNKVDWLRWNSWTVQGRDWLTASAVRGQTCGSNCFWTLALNTDGCDDILKKLQISKVLSAPVVRCHESMNARPAGGEAGTAGPRRPAIREDGRGSDSRSKPEPTSCGSGAGFRRSGHTLFLCGCFVPFLIG